MRHIFTFFLLLPVIAMAQTPHVNIKFRCEEIMYHGDTCQSFYKIILNQYKPKSTFTKSDGFSYDTSLFDWGQLNIDDTESQFHKNNLISDSLDSYILKYVYSQQEYVFENIFEIIIERKKCGINERMRFYFPVKISSFITDIKLSPVYFIPGDFNLTNDIIYNPDRESNNLIMYLKDDYWIKK